jgi:hypothetical protein
MPGNEPNVDWEKIKGCIVQIDRVAKEFLYHAVMIGGAATWFYRHKLGTANDRDFNISKSNADDEDHWLSRDIDFIGIPPEEALLLLPAHVVSENGRKHIEIEGVRVGFAQVGLTFDADEVFQNARAGRISHSGGEVEVFIADPLSLYFEKCKLRQQRGYESDRQHASLLFEYVAFELANGAKRVLSLQAPPSEARSVIGFWERVKQRAPELLQDQRVIDRTGPLLHNKADHVIARCLAYCR